MVHPPSVKDWIFAQKTDQTYIDDSGHGTSVASKALGYKSGVSKNSRLIIVKCSLTTIAASSAFKRVVENITTTGRGGKAVVVMSRTSTGQGIKPGARRGHYEYIQDKIGALRDLNVPVVVSGGNGGAEHKEVNGFPALLGRFSGDPTSLIAVGAVDKQGKIAGFSQHPKDAGWGAFLWAPGVEVICAENGTRSGYRSRSGTSFAAPMVNFLSHTLYLPKLVLPILLPNLLSPYPYQKLIYSMAIPNQVAGLFAYFMTHFDKFHHKHKPLADDLYWFTQAQASRRLGDEPNVDPLVVWNMNERRYDLSTILSGTNVSTSQIVARS